MRTHSKKWWHNSHSQPKMFCPTCKKCKKETTKCCDKNMVPISYKARAPKVTANKKEWRTFYELFLSNSASQRVIDNMRALKMDVSDNLKKQESNNKKAVKKSTTLARERTLKNEEVDERLEVNMTMLSEHMKNLSNEPVKGKKYFITSNRRYYSEKIFEKFCKDYEVREIFASYDKNAEYFNRPIGFYENTEIGKVFRTFDHFAIFETKVEAELYQWIQHNDTEIYPYKSKMDYLMKKNKIRQDRPEYFL